MPAAYGGPQREFGGCLAVCSAGPFVNKAPVMFLNQPSISTPARSYPTLDRYSAVKLGEKLATPSWLTTAGSRLYFPEIFPNHKYRKFLSGLPATRFSCLYSSDHSSGAGYIGRADFDDPEGTWTDTGDYIYTHADQFETPSVVYDPIGNRVLLYGHRNTADAGVTNNTQHTRALSTATLASGSFTDLGPTFDAGHHNGYARVRYDPRTRRFDAYHALASGSVPLYAYSTSTDGENFTLSRILTQIYSHTAGAGNSLSVAAPVQFSDGRWYVLGTVGPLPLDVTTNTAIVAVEVDYDTRRPIGPMITLLTRSANTTDPDYYLAGSVSLFEHFGTWYLAYTGFNSDSESAVCLARLYEGNGQSTVTPPLVSINSNGSLANPATVTTFVDWDAANEDIPASMEFTVTSGTNASNRVAGQYYEFKSGSGSAQNIRLKPVSAFDPTAHEVVEFRLENLAIDTSSTAATSMHSVNFLDSDFGANLDGVRFIVSNSHLGMSARGYANNVEQFNVDAEMLTLYESNATLRSYISGLGLDVTWRFIDFGTKVLALVEDQVVYYRTLPTITWGDKSIFFYLALFTANPHPVQYMRFSRFSIKFYD
jgi:hypothetical protein